MALDLDLDRYAQLAVELTEHGVPTSRSEAKLRVLASGYGAVLPARETFVIVEWFKRPLGRN